MQWITGTECHAVEATDRPKSLEIKEPTKREQPQKKKGINMNTRGNVEIDTEGSWKDKEGDFDVGDRVMLSIPTELYGF